MKLTVQTENTAACQRTLRIEVAVESVDAEFRRVAAQFQGMAQLPGFRPGRVPLAMVEQRFGRQIEEDVRKALIPESYRVALAEQKIHSVALPKIEQIEFARHQPLRYTATVETAPDFTLPDYKGLPVSVAEPTVSEGDVESALKGLLEQRAEFADVTGRALALGDFAVIHFEGVSGGKPIVELAPRAKTLSEAKNFWLAMTDQAFLPNFCKQLAGAAIGEKRQVLVDFPADFGVKELQGIQATYFVDVVGIKEKKLPPLDDRFAQEFQVPTLSEMRERIRQKMQQERVHRAETEKRNQLITALLSRVSFELPPTVVAAETRQAIYDNVRSLRAQGATDESIEQEKDKIYNWAQQNATERVKAQFILGRIAEAEKIEVAREEMEQFIARLARQHGISPKQARAQLTERGALESLAMEILVGKVLDFLLRNAKVEQPQKTA